MNRLSIWYSERKKESWITFNDLRSNRRSTTNDMPQAASQPAEQKPAQQSGSKLEVDGEWGKLTQKELQRQLGVKVTGGKNRATYRALQRKLGVKATGNFGPITKKALQKKLGVQQDGIVGPVTVKALQRELNAGKVEKW